MTLACRLKKLEMKLLPKKQSVYWLMWKNCQWHEAEGIVRDPNESIKNFQTRVRKTVKKRFIWVK